MIGKDKWEWYGVHGHWVCGKWCRFHLFTKVGKYLVSTVGEYVHPRNSGGSEAVERAYLTDNPFGERIPIAEDKFYETMVFATGPRCRDKDCGCRIPTLKSGRELAGSRSKTRREAQKAHMKLCAEYAEKQ